jgi:crotonobetainyl-CoA:carnitine CoA-transferase CaiB-like acyl-CoA transferase
VGNRLDASAPRNAYRTADDQWVAISSASPNLVVRIYRAVDRADLAEDPDYIEPVRRRDHALEIDQAVADWIAKRTLDDVMAVFEAAEVAAAPIYDARQLLSDEHLLARGTFIQVDDPDFGTATVQGPVVVMSETPGRVDHLGQDLGADNDAIYGGLLGIDAEHLAALRASGTI